MARVVSCTLLVVAMAAAEVAGYGRPVVRFHQDLGTHPQQVGFKPEHPDRGYVGNCGNGTQDLGFFNISWWPKEVDPTEQVHVSADIVAPGDFTYGHVKGQLWYEGNPLMTIDRKGSCEDLAKAVPAGTIELKCPIRKGQRLTGQYVFPDTQNLIGYDGDFHLHLMLTNDKNEHLACIDVKLTVDPLP